MHTFFKILCECEYVSFINLSWVFFFFLLHSKSTISRTAKMCPVPTHAHKYMICNVLQRVDACAKQHEVIKTATLSDSRDKLISPHLLWSFDFVSVSVVVVAKFFFFLSLDVNGLCTQFVYRYMYTQTCARTYFYLMNTPLDLFRIKESAMCKGRKFISEIVFSDAI